MAAVNLSLNDLTTQAISHPHPDGGTVLTLTDGVDVVTVHLGERGLAAAHRESGPDRAALRGPDRLVEVSG